MVRAMIQLLPWALAAAEIGLGMTGFFGGPLSAGALGFPGVTAAFFFMLMGRVNSLTKQQVATLGGQLFYFGGAIAVLASLAGVASFFRASTWWVALPLAIVSCPLLLITTLRFSTVAPRKHAFYGVVVAFGLLGVTGMGHLARLVKGGALPF
jgi:hypothetical protein